MSDTRSTADYRPRHRSRRHRRRDPVPAPDESDSDSGYSTPASDTASRATTRSRSGRKRTPQNALVVREEYHVQRPPRAYQGSEYSDDYDEYTVGGDGRSRGGARQQFREKDRGRDRERGMLIVIAAFMVGLIFCLRESRTRR